MKSLCNSLARRTALLALLVGCLGAMDLETARAQVSGASTRRLLSEQFHASTRVSFARVGGASAERSAIERRLGARLGANEADEKQRQTEPRATQVASGVTFGGDLRGITNRCTVQLSGRLARGPRAWPRARF